MRISPGKRQALKKSKHSEAASLELFTNRFTALAQEMGALLQRTSFSVNVKERLDFSCAVLDPKGYLVVNAPHIPVHLGSMGVCVREVMKVIAMNEGDVVITNHPAFGGSHLPDVTLIKPVFYKRNSLDMLPIVHTIAEIGGSRPGSMPADATTLEEEGVIKVTSGRWDPPNAGWLVMTTSPSFIAITFITSRTQTPMLPRVNGNVRGVTTR